MSKPAALVRLEILAIDAIPSALWKGASRVYAIGRINARRVGRSRQVPYHAARFDLSAEPVPWSLECVLAKGEPISVSVMLCDDRGDGAPDVLVSLAFTIPDPWKEGAQTLGKEPRLECRITTVHVPDPYFAATLPAVPYSAPTGTRAPMLPAMVCEWAGIKGLYEPGHLPAGLSVAKQAEHHAGYFSRDDKGRIYLNRDLSGAWKKDYQAIELTVKVTAIGFLSFPSAAKIKWTVADPDDPGNDDPEVHRQWAAYLDPNDYSAGTSSGSGGGDNIGSPDRSPAWEAVGPYALGNATAASAETTIDKGFSSVMLHCPNTAGDNLILRAEVLPGTPPLFLSFPAITGIMTMWNRIDVEYLRMASAFPLPVPGRIPDYFLKAFIQIDFAPEKIVADKADMGTDATLTRDTLAYIDSVFSNKAAGGWFCILSAMEPYALPAVKGRQLFDGDVDLHEGGSGADRQEYIEIPGTYPAPHVPDFVEFVWGKETVGFQIASVQAVGSGAAVKTRCWLQAHDTQDLFTAGDGSIRHAYAASLYFFPRAKLDGASWIKGGYGIPDRVRAIVKGPGAFYVAGISPSVTKAGIAYFAGRTALFSHHRKYRDEATGKAKPDFPANAEAVIVHELVHAFGMPHKCGYWDFRAPRRRTCCMNYRPNWMLTPTRDLEPGTSDKVGNDMCGRHLMEVRKVHLEDNKGLGWP